MRPVSGTRTGVSQRMGRISDDDIQKVREATDIVALVGERTRVQQRGREFWACCPLHNEKTPSFKMDPATQLWHCFGCGEGGDAFGFVMKLDDITFPEAVRKLAERARIDITEDDRGGMPSSQKQRLRDACKAAAEYFHTQLMRSADGGAANARAYLASRDLGGQVPKDWQLGYAPGRGRMTTHLLSLGFTPEELVAANISVARNGNLNDRFYERVMFPIHDVSGECIAFGGRIIGQGEPKYLNSQETPIFHKSQVLFALDKAKAKMASTGCAIVAEGYTDVIAMHEAGITNSVATLGTALTKSHIRLLSRHAGKRIVYLFDGDAAGQRATERALQFIDEAATPESGRSQTEICALCLPDGKDPAEFLADHDAEALQALIDEAQPLVQFGIERRLARHDVDSAEGRARALPDALSVLAPIKDSLLAKEYAVQIAQRLRVREEDALEQLARLQKPRVYDDEAPGEAPPAPQPAVHLRGEEANRLALERQLLGTFVQHPLASFAYVDAIAQTQWHFKVHERIAQAAIGELALDLNASPAKLMDAAAKAEPRATSLLTAVTVSDEHAPESVIGYLVQELQIGDMEDEATRLKQEMTNAANGSPEEAQLFQQLVALQEKLLKAQKERRALA